MQKLRFFRVTNYAICILLAVLISVIANPAFAVRFGAIESSELYSTATSGPTDIRGKTRYERLVEIFKDWESVNVDFGVIVGDVVSNSDTGIPLLLQAISEVDFPIYLVLGNHDWSNQRTPDGLPHPDNCYNITHIEQTFDCPNYIEHQDYLLKRFGFTRPWYTFENGNVVFVVLADERFELGSGSSRFKSGESDIYEEQFEWFKRIVNENQGKIIVVLAHHPAAGTVMGSHFALNRLGWNPRFGDRIGDGRVNVQSGSTLVTLNGSVFDHKRVKTGSEFSINGESQWYKIASISATELILEEPYGGDNKNNVKFSAGGHFNELTQLILDPNNSIRLMLSGHTGFTFDRVDANGRKQFETINDKLFAYVGTAANTPTRLNPIQPGADGYQLATTDLTNLAEVLPGAKLQINGTNDWLTISNITWPEDNTSPGTINLTTPTSVSRPSSALVDYNDQFSQSRVITIENGITTVENRDYSTNEWTGVAEADDFESGTLPNWSFINGNWHVTSSRLVQDSNDQNALAIIKKCVGNNYSLSADILSNDNDGIGFVFRYQNPGNMYFFEMDDQNNQFVLGKIVDGQRTLLASKVAGYIQNKIYKVKVVLYDQYIRVFIDDVPTLFAEDQTYPSGSCGLLSRNNNASFFDNVKLLGAITHWTLEETFEGLTIPSWEYSGGQWSLASGKLAQSSNDNPALAIFGDNAWSNYTLFAEISSSDNDGIGLVARYSDPLNMYFFEMDAQNQTYVLGKYVGGSRIILSSINGTYEPSINYRIKLEVINDVISAYLNDNQILQVQDSTFSVGRPGLLSRNNSGTLYDDVQLVTH